MFVQPSRRMGLKRGVASVTVAAAVLVSVAVAYAHSPLGRARLETKPAPTSARPSVVARRRRMTRPLAGLATHPPTCTHSRWKPTHARAYAAMVTTRRATVWSRPSGGTVLARFPRINGNGYPTVFAVLDATTKGCRPLWFRVQLPRARNGGSAWVRPWSVATFVVHSKILVQLTRRRLIAYWFGKPVLTARVAVGRADAPTPVGRFFVDARFLLRDVSGPFGVAVLGVAAHSEAATGWARGRPIALHGTNDPASIGQASSHGCVRMANPDMLRLFRLTPAGTPVVISS
jgi:L,D-transpeptidase-like protein